MGLRAGLGLSFAFTSEETDEKRANQLTFAPGGSGRYSITSSSSSRFFLIFGPELP